MSSAPSEKTYIAIDLKSFYASVECVARGLNPLDANLVVADASRTEKTICLAVTPSLKACGIPGRARLFEVVRKVNEINARRLVKAPGRSFRGSSCSDSELKADPSLKLDYITAVPRMSEYMKVSTAVYKIYTRYIAPQDIHVYSIDEVFIDATTYLETYGMTAKELAMKLIKTVLRETGVTATAGIGTNLYLSKIAMDIEAKHIPPDENGVRIAELDEESYREKLWTHRPLTSFWRIGSGIGRKLERYGIYTMGDIAAASLQNEDILYRLFGINAELIIDHAWGWEPCTIDEIKACRPKSSSISSGQVLSRPYSFTEGRVIIREMTDKLVLDLVAKGLETDQMVISVGYDVENLADPARRESFTGEITEDYYGRKVPKYAHGSANLGRSTSSTRLIMDAVTELYDSIVDRSLLVRRLRVAANHVAAADPAEDAPYEQTDLFTDYEAEERKRAAEKKAFERERRQQETIIGIREKFGSNMILRGSNFLECSTVRERNGQVGGHRA